jgi:hypothetical protein
VPLVILHDRCFGSVGLILYRENNLSLFLG